MDREKTEMQNVKMLTALSSGQWNYTQFLFIFLCTLFFIHNEHVDIGK